MTATAEERFGERTALVEGDTKLSYHELVRAARSFNTALRASV